MEQQLFVKALLVSFVLTSTFAVINAHLGKWGPEVAMLGMAWMALIAGSFMGEIGYLTAFPLVATAGVAATWIRAGRRTQEDVVGAEDPKVISDRMLPEMNRRIEERKQARSAI